MTKTKDPELIPNQALIYESVYGVVYARYRDPPYNEIPRWVVGGQPESFLPNGKPADLIFDDNEKNFRVNWDLMIEHTEMQKAYKEFLKVQDKYVIWSKLSE